MLSLIESIAKRKLEESPTFNKSKCWLHAWLGRTIKLFKISYVHAIHFLRCISFDYLLSSLEVFQDEIHDGIVGGEGDTHLDSDSRHPWI